MTDVDASVPFASSESKIGIKTIALASLVGTTIEWYDFFVFGSLSAIVFPSLFFPSSNALASELLAYGTFAAGFLVRPLGGIIFGHFGDKIGRRKLLVLSLAIMGLGTFLMGALPTFGQAGLWAPIGLVVLRCVQGFALGGEWGGAVLMSYESADKGTRTLYASFPQMGLALGLFLSTATIGVLSGFLSSSQFLSWGWRIPFLASLVLLFVGFYIRNKTLETPEFEKTRKDGGISRIPLFEVLANHKRSIILALGSNLVMGVVFSAYCVYGLGLIVKLGTVSRTLSLVAVSASALLLLATIPLSSMLADKIGKRPVYFWASIASGVLSFPVFWSMIYSGSDILIVGSILIAYGLVWGPLYGPQAAIYCELFDPRLRFSGISFIYQVGAVISISLTPLIATALFKAAGDTPWFVASYVTFAAIISAVCISYLKIDQQAAA